MSRIGKKPIIIPAGVEIKVDQNKVTVKGPKGELAKSFWPGLAIGQQGDQLFVGLRSDYHPSPSERKKQKALWGLTAVLLKNMIQGVTEGFQKQLEIQGVGYRAYLEGPTLVLEVGFSHPLKITPPKDIVFSVTKNIITITGLDKEVVGNLAAQIRALKPPEPYKGKGIRYLGEVVRKKVGKRAVAAGQ